MDKVNLQFTIFDDRWESKLDKKAIEKLFILTRGMVKICLLSTDDEFRKIAFKEPITNKVMKNHSIRTEDVPNEGSCRVLCYMDPDCVSINLGPFIQGKHTCQLNNATEKSLANEQGFTYYAIEVTSTFDLSFWAVLWRCYHDNFGYKFNGTL